jgi:hypothetical protein
MSLRAVHYASLVADAYLSLSLHCIGVEER